TAYVCQIERLQHRDDLPGFWSVALDAERLQADYRVFADLVGEHGAHRATAHLDGQRLAIVARMRAEDDTAAAPLGRADRALPRPARALLFPGLATAAAHVGALLRVMRALALIRLFSHDRLMYERFVELHAEDRIRQRQRTD